MNFTEIVGSMNVFAFLRMISCDEESHRLISSLTFEFPKFHENESPQKILESSYRSSVKFSVVCEWCQWFPLSFSGVMTEEHLNSKAQLS